jgi:hypothetical protein
MNIRNSILFYKNTEMEDNSKGGNSSISSFSDILPREQEG